MTDPAPPAWTYTSSQRRTTATTRDVTRRKLFMAAGSSVLTWGSRTHDSGIFRKTRPGSPDGNCLRAASKGIAARAFTKPSTLDLALHLTVDPLTAAEQYLSVVI